MSGDSKDTEVLLTLLAVRGLSRRRVRSLTAAAQPAHGSLAAVMAHLQRVAATGADPDVGRLVAALAEVKPTPPLAADIAVVGFSDGSFPPLLRAIPDPPLALFARGEVSAVPPRAVAIVGSRRCTPQGRSWAHAVAEVLASTGVTIVSGLAHGIDAAAHRGALAGGGPTVAVLGSGLQHVYPAQHRALAAEIIAGCGAVVSEYPPWQTPRREFFPERNRIVSGLANAVIVVEAGARSGSLITARLALEQGRDVMAVPGAVGAPTATGCHRLIKQGAALVEDAADVLEVLGWASAPAAPSPDLDLPLTVLETLAAIAPGVTPFDRIVAATGLSASAVLESLTTLELEGFIEACHGGYIRRPFHT